jgi:hypothetical protein
MTHQAECIDYKSEDVSIILDLWSERVRNPNSGYKVLARALTTSWRFGPSNKPDVAQTAIFRRKPPFDSIRKVGCMNKYLMMVWTHQVSCFKSSILLSVFNSHLSPSGFSIPRPLAYRQFSLLSNQLYMVVLKACNVVMSFISVMPSGIYRFWFTASWLCEDYIAAQSFVVNLSRQRIMTAPSPR